VICPAYLETGLEATFSAIQRERMVDIPILNPRLQVQAVGFSEWEDCCLGVLITPWFMNLMLLPQEGDEWAELPSGTKVNHSFPSGTYEFIVGEEEGIGHYQMCSLFSPMFEFEDQAAAVATAEAVLEGILDEANRDEVSTRESEIQKIWRGEGDAMQAQDTVTRDGEADSADAAETSNSTETASEPAVSLEDRIEQPMSRRDLLRGAFLRKTSSAGERRG